MEANFSDTIQQQTKQCLAYPTNGNKATKTRVKRLLDTGDFHIDDQANITLSGSRSELGVTFWKSVRSLVLPGPEDSDVVVEWDSKRTNYGLEENAPVEKVESLWKEVEEYYRKFKRERESNMRRARKMEEDLRHSRAPEMQTQTNVNIPNKNLEEAREQARKKSWFGRWGKQAH